MLPNSSTVLAYSSCFGSPSTARDGFITRWKTLPDPHCSVEFDFISAGPVKPNRIIVAQIIKNDNEICMDTFCYVLCIRCKASWKRESALSDGRLSYFSCFHFSNYQEISLLGNGERLVRKLYRNCQLSRLGRAITVFEYFIWHPNIAYLESRVKSKALTQLNVLENSFAKDYEPYFPNFVHLWNHIFCFFRMCI